MFWKRYYKSFSVRMEIIANNAIIVFCHLVEVAIFAVRDFFSLFSIAVFNIPISHKIIILLFLLQSYCFFSYFQIFLNFFCWSCVDLPTIAKIYFVLLPFPVVVCPGRGRVSVSAVSVGGVAFSLSDYTQKERAQFLASSLLCTSNITDEKDNFNNIRFWNRTIQIMNRLNWFR